MVLVKKAAESIVIGQPGQETTVCSMAYLDDHRRFRESVHLRPSMAPVRHADTIYLHLNSSKKRFLSRTFYERRMAAKGFSQTTFTFPKSVSESFVTYLDLNSSNQRKWFKTSLELDGLVRPLVDINSNSTFSVDRERSADSCWSPGPGASQVYIPKRNYRQIYSIILKPDASISHKIERA